MKLVQIIPRVCNICNTATTAKVTTLKNLKHKYILLCLHFFGIIPHVLFHSFDGFSINLQKIIKNKGKLLTVKVCLNFMFTYSTKLHSISCYTHSPRSG